MVGRARRALALCWAASSSFYRNQCFDQAAVIAFFSLLSLVPFLLLLLSFGAWVLGSRDLASAGTRNLLQAFFQDLDPSILDEAKRISLDVGHEWVFLLLALWTASKVFTKIQSSLDRILGAEGRRSYPFQKLIVFAMVLLVGLVLVTMILIESGMSVAERRFSGSSMAWISSTPLYVWFDRWGTRHAIPWATTVAGFMFVYRFLPARPLRGATVLISSMCAGSLWEIMKAGFTYYVGHVASYTRTYGTLEAVVVFLVWAQLSASILLWGAELAAAMTRSAREAGD